MAKRKAENDEEEKPRKIRTRSMDTNDPLEGGLKSPKKKKKDKTGKKKQKNADASEKSGAVEKKKKKKKKGANKEEKDGEKAKKKKKKKKKSEGEGESAGPRSAKGKFCYYKEHAEVSAMTDASLQEWHEENEITLSGPGCIFKPILEFKHCGFPDDISRVVEDFDKPTPIQSQCWPILMSGRDIVGIAETGSGKTLAFSLPALVHLKQLGSKKSTKGPSMLVVAPTRELAMQSDAVLQLAGKKCGLRSFCIYGGVPKGDQKKALGAWGGKPSVEIVVCTPGRMCDLMQEGVADLSGVNFLVLDEADRMLDLGFEKAMKEIIGATNSERLTAMFSATWPTEVEEIAKNFMSNEVKVTIGSDDLAASKNIEQVVEVVEERERDRLVVGLLNKYHSQKAKLLLFVLYKKEASRIERMLQQRGFSCCSIHGDKSQDARSHALQQFRTGEVPLMIATDVAARGLDIPKVEYVINYSFPLTIEDYVHRIGRTGRAGQKGLAHTFFHVGDKSHAGELVLVLREAGQKVPESLMKFGTHVKKKEHKVYGAFAKDVDMNAKGTKITFDSDSD